jgi:hypothetical protein
MLTFHEPDFVGLFKVISGGQVGADQGGLHAAREMGVATGGTAPLGYRTQTGPNLRLRDVFGLAEHASFSYAPRTRVNVERSDGTLIIASNLASPGCTLTANFAEKTKKPLLRIQVDRDYTNEWLNEQVKPVVHWIIKNRIHVLNVAGNRDTGNDTHHFHSTHKLVTWVLLDLHTRGLLPSELIQYTNE